MYCASVLSGIMIYYNPYTNPVKILLITRKCGSYFLGNHIDKGLHNALSLAVPGHHAVSILLLCYYCAVK